MLHEDLVDILKSSRIILSISTVEFDAVGEQHFRIKIICNTAKNMKFQIWLHKNKDLLRYSYQLYSNKPILRWDNAPHWSRVKTEPHHFHDKGTIKPSRLTGSMEQDIKLVLGYIQGFMENHTNNKN